MAWGLPGCCQDMFWFLGKSPVFADCPPSLWPLEGPWAAAWASRNTKALSHPGRPRSPPGLTLPTPQPSSELLWGPEVESFLNQVGSSWYPASWWHGDGDRGGQGKSGKGGGNVATVAFAQRSLVVQGHTWAHGSPSTWLLSMGTNPRLPGEAGGRGGHWSLWASHLLLGSGLPASPTPPPSRWGESKGIMAGLGAEVRGVFPGQGQGSYWLLNPQLGGLDSPLLLRRLPPLG